MIIDTHTHYDDEAFDEDRDALLSSLKEQGIEYRGEHRKNQEDIGSHRIISFSVWRCRRSSK